MRKDKRDSTMYDMLYLLACGIHEKQAELNYVRQMDLDQVLAVSKEHSVAVTTFYALPSELINEESYVRWQACCDQAFMRSVLLDTEREQLFAFCEDQKIWYLPLKGIVLREYYPHPEMRQMSDNDILYDEKAQQKINDWFLEKGYQIENNSPDNHTEYNKAPTLSYEMHTRLFSSDCDVRWLQYDKQTRKQRIRDSVDGYAYHFSDEDFYLFLILHAYKHYTLSGIGVRALLDVYVFLRSHQLEENYLRTELRKLELNEFEERLNHLANQLFSYPNPKLAQQLSKKEQKELAYFLRSGTHGTQKQKRLNLLKGAGRHNQSYCGYLWRQFFPTKEYMKEWAKNHSLYFAQQEKQYLLCCGYRLWLAVTKTTQQHRRKP